MSDQSSQEFFEKIKLINIYPGSEKKEDPNKQNKNWGDIIEIHTDTIEIQKNHKKILPRVRCQLIG